MTLLILALFLYGMGIAGVSVSGSAALADNPLWEKALVAGLLALVLGSVLLGISLWPILLSR